MRAGEIKRRELSWAINEAQERTRAGMWSWALKECHTVFCFKLFLNSGATDTVFVTQRLKQQVCGTLVPRNGEVPAALTLLLVWRWSTASLVFPGRSARKKERKKKKNHYPPPPPPSLISHFASVDVKQHLYLLTLGLTHRVCHFWQDLYFAQSLE